VIDLDDRVSAIEGAVITGYDIVGEQDTVTVRTEPTARYLTVKGLVSSHVDIHDGTGVQVKQVKQWPALRIGPSTTRS
jgi:hypothetical protein